MSIKDENAEQAITEMNSKMFELKKKLPDFEAKKKQQLGNQMKLDK